MKIILRWLAKILATAVILSLIIVLTPHIGKLVGKFLPDVKGESIRVSATLSRKLEDASMLVTKTVTETGVISDEKMMSDTEVAAAVYIDYTYAASFGVDLSKARIDIDGSKIIMHLPEPEMIFTDSIHQDAIERKAVASTWVKHSDEEVQALLDERQVECRNSYLTGDYLVELRAASERAVDKTIAEWIKEINSDITIEYRWPDQAE